MGRHRAVTGSQAAAARDRRALPPRRRGVRRVGVLGDAVTRPGRAVLGAVGHRQDAGRRDRRRRARPGPLQARPVGGRQQVHRRDREEPRPGLRRRQGRQRRALLRRGRLAVRQALRGARRPRPLRQHRGVLPPAAPRGLRRARDAGDELREEHRRRVPAPTARPHRVHDPRRVGAQGDLGAQPAGRRTARRRRRPVVPRRPLRAQRRVHPQRRPAGRVPRRGR